MEAGGFSLSPLGGGAGAPMTHMGPEAHMSCQSCHSLNSYKI